MAESSMDLSVIIIVGEHRDDLIQIHAAFRDACAQLVRDTEFLFVADRDRHELDGELTRLGEEAGVRILRPPCRNNESAALTAAFSAARGRVVVTLPSYHSVAPEAVRLLLESVENGADCAIAVREKRRDPGFNQFQSRIFHAAVSMAAGRSLRDITNGARAMRAEVAREIQLYGDQHRYLPVLLMARGHQVDEVEVPQSDRERSLRVFGVRTYLNRFMDLISIFFLLRFTQRPLRFFGGVGAAFGGAGFLLCLWLSFERLVMERPLGDRPALLLGVILIVLGVQTASIGLLGELIVHLRSQREFGVPASEVLDPGEDEDPAAGREESPAMAGLNRDRSPGSGSTP